jgi:hypothetical protein
MAEHWHGKYFAARPETVRATGKLAIMRKLGRICSSRVCEELDRFLRFDNELVHCRCGVAFFSSNAQKMLGSGSK